MRAALCIAGLLAACSSARLGSQETGTPSVVWPAHFAEGEQGDGGPPGEVADAATAAQASEPEHAADSRTALPDPEPLALREQYAFDLRYDHGTIRIDRVTGRKFDKPVQTAREMGRFAFELWIGRELIDRVRFDFPLLAAEPAPSGKRRPLDEPPSLAASAEVRRTVLVPKSDRATWARIVDRATGKVVPVPWPPDAPLDPSGGGDAQ